MHSAQCFPEGLSSKIYHDAYGWTRAWPPHIVPPTLLPIVNEYIRGIHKNNATWNWIPVDRPPWHNSSVERARVRYFLGPRVLPAFSSIGIVSSLPLPLLKHVLPWLHGNRALHGRHGCHASPRRCCRLEYVMARRGRVGGVDYVWRVDRLTGQYTATIGPLARHRMLPVVWIKVGMEWNVVCTLLRILIT